MAYLHVTPGSDKSSLWVWNLFYNKIPYCKKLVRKLAKISIWGNGASDILCVYHAVPPSPTGVIALRLNGTHMNVSWNRIPLSEAKGFIVSYRVLYQKITTERRRRQVTVIPVPGSDTSAIIGDLNPSSSYQVFVSAATSAGIGEYSSNPVVARSKLTIVISLILGLSTLKV